jgi:hypothetical protein
VASALIAPEDKGTYRSSSSAAYREGDVYIHLVTGSPTYQLVQLSKLSTDGTVAAALQRQNLGDCVPIGNAPAGTFVFAFSASQTGLFVGLYRTAVGNVVWPDRWLGQVPLVTSTFSNDDGWGMAFYDGTIRFVASAAAPKWAVLDHAPAASHSTAGIGSAIFWSALDSTSQRDTIRRYTPGTGAALLVAQPANIRTVAASDDHLAWIGKHGPGVADGKFDAAEMYWSPLPAGSAAAVVTNGPSLPAKTNLNSLQTGGDYAATIGCGEGLVGCQVIVVQLSTKKLWAIRERPGSLLVDVMAVSPREILVSEIDATVSPDFQQIQRIVRLDVGSLDALQQAR